MTVLVDAHHHVWDGDLRRHQWLRDSPELQRPFDLSDYKQATQPCPPEGSVLVQVEPDEHESTEFLCLAACNSVVKGVVGFVDLLLPDAGDRIDLQRAAVGGDLLVGLRQALGVGHSWFEHPTFMRGLEELVERDLAFDLLVRPNQLRGASKLVARLPEGRFVLDHGGNPAIDSGEFQPWADDVAELATNSSVRCKLSGLTTRAGVGWCAESLAPYVAHLVEVFGADRLLFGSDWPVCILVATFTEVLSVTKALLTEFCTPGEVEVICGTNTIKTYQLSLP